MCLAVLRTPYFDYVVSQLLVGICRFDFRVFFIALYLLLRNIIARGEGLHRLNEAIVVTTNYPHVCRQYILAPLESKALILIYEKKWPMAKWNAAQPGVVEGSEFLFV